MTGQYAEIVAMAIEDAVEELGGNEDNIRTLIDASECDEDAKRILASFARNVIRYSGGIAKRRKSK